MANINKSPSFTAAKGYNGFDMSQDRSFTSSTGQLIPVYYDILSPGDKVSLNSEMITRTMEIDSSANQELSDVIDYFFVPLEQLNSYFGQLFYGVRDPKSTNLDPLNITGGNIDNFPLMRLGDAVNAFIENVPSDNTANHFTADCFRLAASLGLPIDVFEFGKNTSNWKLAIESILSELNTKAVTPWTALAYQKIFNDYYRIDDRQNVDVQSFNVDDLQETPSTYMTQARIAKIFTLRYRPWRKDFFTNLFVSPMADTLGDGYSSPSLLPSVLGEFQNYLTTVTPSQTPAGLNVRPGTLVSSNSTNSINGSLGSINTSSIRNAFAFEKYLEIVRRSGKDYDSQTAAHFGVNIPRGVGNEVQYLGTHSSDIRIGDVISNSTTYQGTSVGTPLGEIAGKGYGYGKGKTISYEAKVHGVLMAIYSNVPKVTYPAFGIDKLNTLSRRTDFFIPEYDNLGMQPLFMSQLRYISNDGEPGSPRILSDGNDILGWQYRYSEFKQKYDVTQNGLLGSLISWQPYKYVDPPAAAEVNSRWYIPDNYLNKMMLVPYDPNNASWISFYDSDPLLHFFRFNVRKASKMSTYSLPQL